MITERTPFKPLVELGETAIEGCKVVLQGQEFRRFAAPSRLALATLYFAVLAAKNHANEALARMRKSVQDFELRERLREIAEPELEPTTPGPCN